jgi:predicted NodU family carbamoyl transferase
MITLGLNYSQMHDSSACIVRDGELLFAVAEERISRLKHDSRFPALAIRACLDFARVQPEQVDEVCLGWQKPAANYRHDLKLYLTGQWQIFYLNILNSTRRFASLSSQAGGANPFTRHFGITKARYRFVDHHRAHAISAYSYSGLDDAAIVVMDGRGAWEATSIWHGGPCLPRPHDQLARLDRPFLRRLYLIPRLCSQRR